MSVDFSQIDALLPAAPPVFLVSRQADLPADPGRVAAEEGQSQLN
jgi:hypothetical protein